MPSLMRVALRVILRVTKFSPRRGDSWLNRMPLHGEQPVGLAIVDGLPVRVHLGAGVGAARMERRGLALRNFGDLARTSRTSPPGRTRRAAVALVVIAHRLQQAQRAQPDHVGGVFGLIEGDAHVRLRGQIVDLVGAHLLDDPRAVRCRRPGRRSAVAAAKDPGRSPCADGRCARWRSSRCGAPRRAPRSPCLSSNSARYEPSCPVTPVISATLAIAPLRIPCRPPAPLSRRGRDDANRCRSAGWRTRTARRPPALPSDAPGRAERPCTRRRRVRTPR